jgi:hypothetical protein
MPIFGALVLEARCEGVQAVAPLALSFELSRKKRLLEQGYFVVLRERERYRISRLRHRLPRIHPVKSAVTARRLVQRFLCRFYLQNPRHS